MSYTQAVREVRKVCEKFGYNKPGYKKYVCTMTEDSVPKPIRDKSWYEGPGDYVVRIWPPRNYNTSPWSKLHVVVPGQMDILK